MSDTCENCRFSSGHKYDLQCRRHAPTMKMQIVVPGYSNGREEDGVFPKVPHDTWCGDHQIKNPKDAP